MNRTQASKIIEQQHLPGATPVALAKAAKRPLEKSPKRTADLSRDPITPSEEHLNHSAVEAALRNEHVEGEYRRNFEKIRGESKRKTLRDVLAEKQRL